MESPSATKPDATRREDFTQVAERIWEAAGHPNKQPAIQANAKHWQAIKGTFGSWENLGRQPENQGPFVVRRLAAKLKELTGV